ncbi:MAG: protein-L-isoaspartate(D-aspartate) O-methyltransferase [Clostridia bacterium]|nr:protein-L-isoaspartate(D-aspartate) O-methyltransferase [Clostridia bacterium]
MGSDMDVAGYFRELDRALFMEGNSRYAGVDAAFPIGHGQTISQPSLVLEMTIMLDIRPGCKVLEIGTGSGYQTALLARFAGSVYTVERIEPLMTAARERLSRLGFSNIHYRLGDGSQGWEENAPYDRIMVTAAAHRIPPRLVDQLAPGGRMVIPVGRGMQTLTTVCKDMGGNVRIEGGIPVLFVDLVGDY